MDGTKPGAPRRRTTAEIWAEDAYAPLVTEGPIVEALRAKLAAIAETLGHPPRVEQVVTVATVGFHKALLERHVTTVRIKSPVFWVEGDERRLGVAVADVQLDGVAIAFTDLRLQQGFHDIDYKNAVRWTNGDAFIILDPEPFERVLRLRVVAAAPESA